VSSAGGAVELRLLGPVEIWLDGELVAAGPPKQRCVLAVLALEANRVVPVETVTDRVWDHAPPPAARALVQTYVARLRRIFARCGANNITLTYRSGGYVLAIDPELVDLHRFRRKFADSTAILEVDPGRGIAGMREALMLWRGDPLSGLDGSWVTWMRDTLWEHWLGTWRRLIDVELEAGDHDDTLGQLDDLLARYPLDEHLIGQRMTALHLADRRAEALRSYRETRSRLLDELGAEPGPALRELHQQLLSRGPDPAPAPDGVNADRGNPTITSGPARPARNPAQLPPAVADFTGRVAQLAQLDNFLPSKRDRPTAAAVIAGSAGMGKTALTVFWAHRVRDQFPDGQLYVNLHGYATGPPLCPLAVLAQFLRAVDVAADRIPVDLDEAAGLYRTMLADKRMLVVLDNAVSADQVRPLLPASPSCLAVITSRNRLGGLVAHDGARRIELDVLSPTEARTLLIRALGASSVQAEPDSAAELARLCAYLPLALRIAAANIASNRRRCIADQVAELHGHDRLAKLEIDEDDQAAIRASFDLSYDTLKPDARQLFRRLGLVPGPDVTVPVAAILAEIADDRARRLLNDLAGAHLVDQATPGRFAVHDLLRLYARDRAADEDGHHNIDQTIQRLFDFYLRTTHAAVQALYPQMVQVPITSARSGTLPRPAEAKAWLDTERPNIVAATRYAAEYGPQPVAWQLAETLRGYFWHNRYTIDWFTVAQAGLSAATAEGEPRVQAVAHQGLGQVHHSVTRYPLAITHFTTALDLARQAGWLAGQASALNNLGCVHEDLGQLDRATARFTQSLRLSRQAGSPRNIAAALTNLGEVSWQQGRLRPAANQFTRALNLNREIGSIAGQATCLRDLGNVHWQLGQLDDAVYYLDQALALQRDGGSRFGEATTLHDLSAVHHDAGRLDLALELAATALTLTEKSGDRRNQGNALNILGAIHRRLGNADQAISHHQQALDLDHDTGHPYREAEAHLGLAAAYRDVGHNTAASTHAHHALTVIQHTGIRILEGQALTTIARNQVAEGRHADAARHAEQSLAIQRKTRQRLGQAHALHTLGQALRQIRGVDAALPIWREALRLYTVIGVPEAGRLLPLHAAEHRAGDPRNGPDPQ
jgi:tetratricopeptide (TPR) repeat protein